MLLRALAHDLALDRAPRPLLDRAAAALVLTGLAGCVLLWTLLGVDPAGSLLRGAWAWIGAIVFQPLIEEVLFRGLLQGVLLRMRGGRRSWAGLTLANLAASSAFVAAHLMHHGPLWALATLPPSLALGWLRERRGSTWSPVATHAAFNLEFFATAAAFAR